MRSLKWFLGRLWTGWKKFAHVVGVVNRYILLTVFYWVILDLVNIGLRLFRVDLLDRRMRPAETYWRPKTQRPKTYENQF